MSYQSLKLQCQLEQEIMKTISSDNGATAHFRYEPLDSDGSKLILTLITTNPDHKEVFKLYTTNPHSNPYECLNEVKAYLDSANRKESGNLHYKVVWFRTEDPNNKFTSHFIGKDFLEIVGKFFEDKNPQDFVIISFEMAPIA